jgi:hypothetical protein
VQTLIPALRILRQEDYQFKASLEYTVKPCLKNNKTKQHKDMFLLKFLSQNLSLQDLVKKYFVGTEIYLFCCEELADDDYMAKRET